MMIYPNDERINNTLELNIRDLCFLANKSYKEIALECGINYKTLSNYLSHTQRHKYRIPNAMFIIRLADYFNVNPRDLLLKRVCK